MSQHYVWLLSLIVILVSQVSRLEAADPPYMYEDSRSSPPYTYENNRSSYEFYSRHYYPSVFAQPMDTLPDGFISVVAENQTYYYADGLFYQMDPVERKYVIVAPPIGAIVHNLPEGYRLAMINGESFYEFNGIYYQRIGAGFKVIEPPEYAIIEHKGA